MHDNKNYLTVTESDFIEEGVVCAHCGKGGLKCDHPSGWFDEAQQAFVCSWCGEVDHNSESLARLRAFAKSGVVPEMQNIIDCTDH